MSRLLIVVIAPLFLTACNSSDPKTELPTFDDPQLSQGKAIWGQVCRACHLTGVAGAPAINDSKSWSIRLSKGKAALYKSAINGIQTDQGWTMPPKGGNERLSEVEVRLAVDYMLAAQATFKN